MKQLKAEGSISNSIVNVILVIGGILFARREFADRLVSRHESFAILPIAIRPFTAGAAVCRAADAAAAAAAALIEEHLGEGHGSVPAALREQQSCLIGGGASVEVPPPLRIERRVREGRRR